MGTVAPIGRVAKSLAIACVCLPAVLAGCGSVSTVPHQCSYRLVDYDVVGSLVARRGDVATFAIVSVTSRAGPPAQEVGLERGLRVGVSFDHGGARFLRLGTRYLVRMNPTRIGGARFESEIDTPGTCSTGTVYADGSRIDTSRPHHWFAPVVIVPVAVVGAIGSTVVVRRRRRRASTFTELRTRAPRES